jgi:hypothetical protein
MSASFDILDSLLFQINDRLDLGIPTDRVNFANVQSALSAKTKKTLAMLASLATIGAISLSSLVNTTTPIYADSPSYHAYCYSREHPFGEDPVVFCAYGTGAEQLCEKHQAADPEALTECHRMDLAPNESLLATTYNYGY